MKESDLQLLIRVGLARVATLFRHNVGTGWVGFSIPFSRRGTFQVESGDVLIRQARPLHSGLVKGGSDLLGWKTVLITPEMVGQRLAVFAACEIKTKVGRVSEDQHNFIKQLTAAGGIAVVARSVEQAVGDFEGWRPRR